MWKVALRGLLAHKLRFVLTGLSIVLGVGFVAGTFVLTDTIDRTFRDLFTETTKGIDVAVRGKEAFAVAGGGELREPVPAALVEQVGDVPGVAFAEGYVFSYAQFVGKDGEPVTTGGAPTLGMSLHDSARLRAGATMREGEYPRGSDEVVVDRRTADKQGYRVGDRVQIQFQGGPGEFTISGIIGFGPADNLAGATMAGFDLTTAQRVLNREGVFDQIDVVAEPGVGLEVLRDRIAAAVGPGYQTLTNSQLVEEIAAGIAQFTDIINYALLAFAFIALFVGSFIIVNTFTIILAQRTRELALLRCIGASQGQVLASVLAEALVIGLVAAVVGLGSGVLIAMGLRSVFALVGADLPTTSLVVEPRTIVVGLAVGVGVTLLASLVPALKAIRVSPVAALRERAVTTTRSRAGRLRVVTGALVTATGVALLLLGLFGSAGNELLTIAAGVVAIFIGVAVLSALVARPMARLIGWPFAHWSGQPGKIARDNSMRHPRRTASTAAALMIGLALVSLVTIFAASLKKTVNSTFDQAVTADYVLATSSTSGQGFSAEVARRLAEQPEIAAAAGVRMGPVKVDGVNQPLFGADPVAYDRTTNLTMTAGSLTDLTAGGAAVRADVAAEHGWRVGDTATMDFPVGGAQRVPVRAIYEGTDFDQPFVLALSDFERYYADQLDLFVLVKAESGVPAAVSRAAVERVTADFPTVQVSDHAEYKEQQTNQIDQILMLFYLLLALAVVIACIGIVNTLALSVLERVRELGLLRALGMTRTQLRAMIRWEAVIIAVLGASLGLVVGTFFGWTLVRALRDQGVTEFALPVGTLLLFVLAAAVAGVLAAILPGRRAARIDMLRAITTE
ncbi:ABC transporter permease [Actinophytocola sp.]|uniref:ABC transporter permease n=1 Tax=Actinophytocola sp. TaxID=1872138 RepID=UPI002ED06CCA